MNKPEIHNVEEEWELEPQETEDEVFNVCEACD